MSSMFEVAVRFNMRLPKLFCGFARAFCDSPVGEAKVDLTFRPSGDHIGGQQQRCDPLLSACPFLDAWNSDPQV
ncbi:MULTISPECIES: hypothetical protein [unclassified Mesorhizobium]|uniref:hypothetical protein n=1 Tax=unclassified Mesorhizobium TaxID=325217 RepID=UPI001CCD0C6B|nr:MULTISPECIES: hypothetical protein [unclassified Mesorhizobium]MBZ9965705.1 hypothetical protein [Mesorhizobium sp. BR1-1-2]MCA0011822.1 hypothetical protein [Mesorhizobium sp. B294B1A1]